MASSPGTVYVFNATPNDMLLLLNNHVLTSSLAGISSTSSYNPNQVTAPRNPSTGDPGVAEFGGTNTLVVSFPTGTSQTYPIVIDSNAYQIQEDLQLYIFFNVTVLVGPEGVGQQQVIQGGSVSAEQQALIDKHSASKY